MAPAQSRRKHVVYAAGTGRHRSTQRNIPAYAKPCCEEQTSAGIQQNYILKYRTTAKGSENGRLPGAERGSRHRLPHLYRTPFRHRQGCSRRVQLSVAEQQPLATAQHSRGGTRLASRVSNAEKDAATSRPSVVRPGRARTDETSGHQLSGFPGRGPYGTRPSSEHTRCFGDEALFWKLSNSAVFNLFQPIGEDATSVL